MASTDSMFLIEVAIQTFKNSMFCKDFDITAKFSNVFKMTLKKPTRRRRKRVRRGKEERRESIDIDVEDLSQTDYLEMKLKTGEAVLLPTNILSLSMQMKTCPMELTIWRREPRCPMGSTKIPWSPAFWSYLTQAYNGERNSPVTVIETVDLYNDTTFKLVASAKLKIKVSYLRYRAKPPPSVSSDPRLEPLAVSPAYEQIRDSFHEAIDNVPHEQLFILLPEDKQPYIVEEFDDATTERWTDRDPALPSIQPLEVITESSKSSYTTVSDDDHELNRLTILSLTKSETKFTVDDDVKKFADLTRSRSASAFNMLDRCNPLDYIFLNKDQPFADQLYTVGYMAVVKKDKKTAALREKADKDACACKSAKPCLWADNIGKIADPCVVECKGLSCERDMLPPPDNRLLLSLSKSCCEVQELHGEMKASIRAGEHPDKKPCECACECTFTFVNKTAYCKICGGYESTKGDLDDPTIHPCPIFHKDDKMLLDTGVGSGSRRKKRAVNNEDEDKDRDLDEARFKFNYGYQAPHIGHGNCALSCIGGDGGPVPKTMGWLWTSENVPGLKRHKFWRPGAISKRLLRQLNKAKQRTAKPEEKQTSSKKKQKKPEVEEKPTLLVTRKNGEYRVEMQVSPEANETTKPSPLIYKIASADNEAKLKKREIKQHRIIKETIKNNWKGPYHPEACEAKCLKAYQQAVGILPYDANNPECICPGVEIREEKVESCSCDELELWDESSESGSEVEWEIHFTPPKRCGES